jgi:MoaA/NifB/PqqE/SkfB family radical SAM enzyme
VTLVSVPEPLRKLVHRAGPSFVKRAKSVRKGLEMLQHSAALVLPQVIQPDPSEIYLSLTSFCNLRCVGCRYGRDFMSGTQLSWEMVKGILEDCAEYGIRNIRLYGGEPLLHRDITKMVEYSVKLGLHPFLTTNGILLEKKFDELYAAGLRKIGIGFYGTGDGYNQYVQRENKWPVMERGVAYAREKGGKDLQMSLGWLLMRPTCTVRDVENVWNFAVKYNTIIGVSLVHYSLPYFTEGPDKELQFRPEDEPAIRTVVVELLKLKKQRPELIQQSELALRSVPDWLLRGPNMKVPCDRYKLLWVGPDGTVQMCYVTFKLGNLHEKRLREMLFTAEHRQAARDAYQLNCPNCHCSYHSRTELHPPSRMKYA